jgi:hypothetical protein
VNAPAERIPVSDVAGQQRFLNAVAACVETTGLPLHARPVLQNLEDGKFEKLSFLTGTVRGLLERPAEVSSGIRAGSIFMLPLYIWIAIVVGRYHDKPWDDPWGIVLFTAVVVLGAMALADFASTPMDNRRLDHTCWFAGRSPGCRCFCPCRSWPCWLDRPKVSPLPPLWYCFSSGSARRCTPSSIPTADGTTGWRAPGWCGDERKFVSSA